MQPQSSLGNKKVHRVPSYHTTNIGRVTSLKDYEKFGIIEVVFLNHGMPFPVWVVNDIEREPVTGDQVIIGYIDGRKDAPYLAGFVKNYSYTTNFVTVSKDRIRLQLPIFEIGVKDGKAHKDVQSHLLDEAKLKSERVYVELSPSEAVLSFPVKDHPPAYFKLTSSGNEIYHPTGNTTVISHGDLPSKTTNTL